MSTTLATAIDVGSRRQLFIDDRLKDPTKRQIPLVNHLSLLPTQIKLPYSVTPTDVRVRSDG